MPASIWRYQLHFLAEKFSVLAFDPRGQGESEVAASGYAIEQRSRDIASCVENLGHVVLVGWSLGALEAAQYVHAFGEGKLAGVVLVDSSVGEDPAPPSSGAAFREALRVNRREAVREFVRGMFRTFRSDDEIDHLTRGALRLSLEQSLALFPSHLPREHWRSIVRRMSAPLMYVVSPQFAEQAANLQRVRPATQVEIFEGAGHALFVDEPRRFNRCLLEFVRGIRVT